MVCVNCKRSTKQEDLCPDDFCRDCHVSLTFEDCCDGTWAAQTRMAGGMISQAQAREEYPNSRLWKDGAP